MNTRLHAIPRNSTYIPGIDGLRAIAVLSVLLYHLNHIILPAGFIGVDVFFVISGYVISKSLVTGKPLNLSNFILTFYKRRILRIVPALLFFLVITSLFSTLFIPRSWLSSPNNSTALSAFFGVSNLYLVYSADGYFSNRISFNPFIHTWSLAVEEQFYAIFPLIFYFWLKTFDSHSSYRKLATWLLAALSLLSLGLAAYQTTNNHDLAFYLLPSRFWELAAGALLFQTQTYNITLPALLNKSIWPMIGGCLLLIIGFFCANELYFPFPWALAPVLGSVLIIGSFTGTFTTSKKIATFFENPLLVYIGRISYSLYLWHWGVFTLIRWTVGLSAPSTIIMALTLTFGLAAFSYHFIENKFRFNTFLKQRSSPQIIFMCLFTLLFSSYATNFMFKHYRRLGLAISVTNNDYDWSSDYFSYHTLTPSSDKNSLGYGRRVFIVGDSHAGAYYDMVKLATQKLGAEMTLISGSGCPVADLLHSSKSLPKCSDAQKQQDILNTIKTQAHPGDIVFLASLRLNRLSDQWGEFDQKEIQSHNSIQAREERKRALIESKNFIKKLKMIGVKVLMDAPKPIFKAPPFRCSDWFNRMNPICDPGFQMHRDMLLKYREPTMNSLTKLKNTTGLYVWDPFPILCNESICSAFDKNIPVFFDADHLSGYGNRLLVSSFTKELETIWKAGMPLANY